MGRWEMHVSEIKKLHWLPPDGCWQRQQVGGPCPGTALHLALAAARGRCREDGTEIGNGLSTGGTEAAGRTTCTGFGGHRVLRRWHGARAVGGSWKLKNTRGGESVGDATWGYLEGLFLRLRSLLLESNKHVVIKRANNDFFNKSIEGDTA